MGNSRSTLSSGNLSFSKMHLLWSEANGSTAGRLHEMGPAAPFPPPHRAVGRPGEAGRGRQNNGPQRCLILVSELRLCHLCMVKTLWMQLVHDLEMENDPGLSGGPNGITKVLRRGRQEDRRQRRRCEDKQRSGGWALKVEEGATSHGRQVPRETGTGQERGPPQSLWKGRSAGHLSASAPWA